MPTKSMSQREYARHRKASGLAGGTTRAVQVAIKSGRLSSSLTHDRRIADTSRADAEWSGTTQEDRVPLTGPTSPTSATPSGPGPSLLQEHRARREAATAELAEIELAEKRRELVPAADVEARLVNVFASCRTKLLGIPSRARQRDPSLTAVQISLLEALIREALEDLADS